SKGRENDEHISQEALCVRYLWKELAQGTQNEPAEQRHEEYERQRDERNLFTISVGEADGASEAKQRRHQEDAERRIVIRVGAAGTHGVHVPGITAQNVVRRAEEEVGEIAVGDAGDGTSAAYNGLGPQ